MISSIESVLLGAACSGAVADAGVERGSDGGALFWLEAPTLCSLAGACALAGTPQQRSIGRIPAAVDSNILMSLLYILPLPNVFFVRLILFLFRTIDDARLSTLSKTRGAELA
jgi:hypothetical protein